ncbi:MAG: CRTAC1 family protein [Gemmatimonadota bacterium]
MPANTPAAVPIHATTACRVPTRAGATAALIALATLTGCARSAPPLAFTPVQPSVFSAPGALVNAWADVDGDGDPDLFVGFNGQGNRLYRNDDGHFTDIAAAAGLADTLHTRSAAWGDYDGDGDPDLVLGFAIPQATAGKASVLRLYRNDNGHFTDITDAAGLVVPAGATRQFAWVDVDGDGDLDLFTAFRDAPNRLYRNDDGHFTDVAPDIGLADPRRTVGAVWFDYDDDGDLDLFVANMDGSRASGIAIDGRYDTCAFADADNDGDLDLFVNGTITHGTQYRDYLFRDDSTRFTDATPAVILALHADHGAQWADYDHDGALDLALAGAEPDSGTHALLHNDLPAGRARQFIDVRVLDAHGHDLPGAEVRLYDQAGDLLGTRLVDTGSGYNSQNVLPVHFGLPAPSAAGSDGPYDIEVTYPAAGHRRDGTVRGVAAGSTVAVRVGTAPRTP